MKLNKQEQEILEKISERDSDITRPSRYVSPEKLAAFLATLVPEKSEEELRQTLFGMVWPELFKRLASETEQASKDWHADFRVRNITPKSEEMTWNGATPPLNTSPNYTSTPVVQMGSQPHKTHPQVVHLPTPSDAWEEDFNSQFVTQARWWQEHVGPTSIKDFIRSKKKEWEEAAVERNCAESSDWIELGVSRGRTQTLQEIREIVEDLMDRRDKVPGSLLEPHYYRCLSDLLSRLPKE